DRLDPVGFQSDSLLYGLRDGLLVAGTPGSLEPVDGVLGRVPLGLRSVSVDLASDQVAAVSEDGTTAYLAPLSDGGAGATEEGGEDPGLADVATVVTGTDLLPPAWDVHDRLWLVDRTPLGAVVQWYGEERSGVVEVPGVSGQQVTELLVSRDGSRLVVVVRGPRGDSLRVARIRTDAEGGVAGVTRARAVAIEDGASRRIRDVAWNSTTTLAVLNRLTDVSAKVVTVGVDGSPGGLDGITTTLSGATALAGSPAPGARVYAVTDSGLADLNATVRGPRVLDEDVSYLDYAG
ncbi:MAG: LpqB family beta-propeller domain-containing protein, partial [Nocardioides sp.]